MCVLEPTNVFAAQITHVFDDTNIKFFCMEKDAITKVKSLLALKCEELL